MPTDDVPFFEDAELGTAPGDPVLLQVNTRFEGMNYLTYPDANEEGNSNAVFTDDSHGGVLAIQGDDDSMQYPYSEDPEVVISGDPASGAFWMKNTGASDGQVLFGLNFGVAGDPIIDGQEWLQISSQAIPNPPDPDPEYTIDEGYEGGTDGASATAREFNGESTGNVFSDDHTHSGSMALHSPFASSINIRAIGETHAFDSISAATWWTYIAGDTNGWFFVPIAGYYNGVDGASVFLDDRDSTGTLKIWEYDGVSIDTGITFPKDTWVQWQFDGLNLSIHPGGGAAIWTSDVDGDPNVVRAIIAYMPDGKVWIDDVSGTFIPADWNLLFTNVLTEESQSIQVPLDGWVKVEWSLDGAGNYTLKVSNGE